MQPRTLDHVALWVADRDRIADFATEHLGMHVIDRSDRFTLVGRDARRGKLTLFDAEGPREQGALEHVALRVSDLVAARAALPAPMRGGNFELAEGLRIVLVEASAESEYDLDHVALRSRDPEATARTYERYGFAPAAPGPSGAPRVEVGGAWIEFHQGDPGAPERPLLNHVAVLVGSADEHRAEAEARGIEIDSWVEGANTLAVFLRAPEGVRIEYVEHKPTFSLV